MARRDALQSQRRRKAKELSHQDTLKVCLSIHFPPVSVATSFDRTLALIKLADKFPERTAIMGFFGRKNKGEKQALDGDRRNSKASSTNSNNIVNVELEAKSKSTTTTVTSTRVVGDAQHVTTTHRDVESGRQVGRAPPQTTHFAPTAEIPPPMAATSNGNSTGSGHPRAPPAPMASPLSPGSTNTNATSAVAPSSNEAAIEQTRQLVKGFIADIWNRGDIDLIKEICHPALRFNGHVGMDRVGHDGFSRMVTTVRQALTDYHCEIHSMVVESNKAFCRLKFTGKHTGTLLGYPPTGKPVAWVGASEFTCKNGKILKVWELGDVKSLEAQLRADN